ncbi:MAG: hypothetical protein WCT40_00730 [Candidatus Magasanikbacteria bacterium]|jgi:hypothetical protein
MVKDKGGNPEALGSVAATVAVAALTILGIAYDAAHKIKGGFAIVAKVAKMFIPKKEKGEML